MDFSTPEPKPETISNLNQSVIDKNKQDLFKFFNIPVKTKVASTVAGLGLVLFFVAIYSVSFNNQTLNTLYPKDQSQASQDQIPAHSAIQGAGFMMEGSQQLKVGDTFELNLKVKTATETANIMAAQVRFDNTKLEVIGTDDSYSVVKEWIDNNFSNQNGMVSLVASFPKGISLSTADQFSKVTFKAKGSGDTVISIDQKNSHMYRLNDKGEIGIEYDSLPIRISQ